MADVVVTVATLDDAFGIVSRLNRRAIQSITSNEKRSVGAVVLESFEESTHKWAARVDGELMAVWGVWPLSLLTGVGYPWLFASDDLRHIPRITLKVAREAIREMRKPYPHLIGSVDLGFDSSVRLGQHLGFSLKPAVAPFGTIELVSP